MNKNLSTEQKNNTYDYRSPDLQDCKPGFYVWLYFVILRKLGSFLLKMMVNYKTIIIFASGINFLAYSLHRRERRYHIIIVVQQRNA